jgi:hypothetical protein
MKLVRPLEREGKRERREAGKLEKISLILVVFI